MRLFRIIIPVEDIGLALFFYTQVFQQQGERVSPGRHYLNCDGVTLALYDAAADGDPERPVPISEPLYFATDDLEGAYRRCLEAGGRFPTDSPPDTGPLGHIWMRPWGERSFYVQDPFGNSLCFVDQDTAFQGTSG